MAKVILFTGDEWSVPVTLKKDNIPFDVSAATEIKAILSDSDGKNPVILIPEVVLNPVAAGANWSNGIVVVEFAAVDTAPLTANLGYIEIQVDFLGTRTTWPRVQVDIKKGLVT